MSSFDDKFFFDILDVSFLLPLGAAPNLSQENNIGSPVIDYGINMKGIKK